MKEFTMKDIYNNFYDIVEKYDLLSWKIGSIRIWEYSQADIFDLICREAGMFEEAHSSLSTAEKYLTLPRYVYNALTKNPLYGKYNKDILVFNHPRKVLIDKEHVDIYTNFYMQDVPRSAYELYENPVMGNHYKNSNDTNICYLDDLKLRSQFALKYKKVKLDEKDSEKISTIENEIFSTFGHRVNLTKIIKEHMIRFTTYYDYYAKIIEKRKPKAIFVVVSYSFLELIAVAKDKKIPVIEIQHGVITPYSISYNFPLRNRIKYFPDKILAFGSYWTENVDFPVDDCNILPMGFPYLSLQADRYKDDMKEKDEKQILFISQGTIGKELIEHACSLAMNLKSYKIIYKLHPGEYADWKEKYACCMEKMAGLDNFIIVDNNDVDLYKYFATSGVVVGVYSTAIYEAMAFKCRCILVNLPGIDFMENLINYKCVKTASSNEDLLRTVLNKDNETDENIKNIFKSYDKNQFLNFLNQVLKHE